MLDLRAADYYTLLEIIPNKNGVLLALIKIFWIQKYDLFEDFVEKFLEICKFIALPFTSTYSLVHFIITQCPETRQLATLN